MTCLKTRTCSTALETISLTSTGKRQLFILWIMKLQFDKWKIMCRVATLLRGWVGNFMFLTNLWSLLNYLNVFWYLLAHHHTWCVILYHSLNNHWFTNSNNVADQTITNLHASQIVFIGNQFHVSLFKLNKCDEHCQNKIGLNTREKSDATDKQEKY